MNSANNTNPIIFLHIDGILNSYYFKNCLYKMWKTSNEQIKMQDKFGDLFFSQNIDALNYLIENTGANVVVTSWKEKNLEQLREMFKQRGINCFVIDKTKESKTDHRGAEVKNWLHENKYAEKKYVIINDSEEFFSDQQQRLVKINPYYGLTIKDSKKSN